MGHYLHVDETGLWRKVGGMEVRLACLERLGRTPVEVSFGFVSDILNVSREGEGDCDMFSGLCVVGRSGGVLDHLLFYHLLLVWMVDGMEDVPLE